jgi:hypothetical protein
LFNITTSCVVLLCLLLQASGMQEYETAMAPLKKALFSQLFAPLVDGADTAASSSSSTGHSPFKVLEVGIGTGEQPKRASRHHHAEQ